MPQLSLYVNDATMGTLRASAQNAGMSMSKYASNLIRERADHGGWPAGYWENVYGCLGDDFGFDCANDDLNAVLDDACDWFD